MTRFDGVVEASSSGKGGAWARLPVEAAEVFGTRSRFPANVPGADPRRRHVHVVAERGAEPPQGRRAVDVGSAMNAETRARRVGEAVSRLESGGPMP